MTRRYYSSTAQDNTISASMDASQTTVTMTSTLTGFPTQYPFTCVIDQGTASEELVQVTGAPTSLVYPVARGQDGTSGHTHSSTATFKHRASARDFDEPNAHIQLSTGVHGLTAGVAVAGMDSVNLKANDSAVPHLTGNETIAGVKTFSSAPVVPDASFAEAKVANLTTDLATLTTNVSTAQSTATTAASNASTALSTANSASTTATSASTAASSASTAASAAQSTANSAVAALSWTNLSLQTNISAFGGAYGTPQYAKDARGVVYLRGMLHSSATISNATALGTLPSGNRPAVSIQLSTFFGVAGAGGIQIDSSGNITALVLSGVAAGNGVTLTGLSFDTAS